MNDSGEKIERLLGEIKTAAPAAWDKVDELVRVIVELYGDGLARVMELLDDDGRAKLGRDPLVTSLLVLHGLHPDDVETRVQKALDGVRPYLGSHAGGVAVLGIDAEAATVHLRLEGSCHGCPSSLVTVKMAIERAILDAAPEIMNVAVEGTAAEPVGDLVQLRRPVTESWSSVGGLERLADGALQVIDVAGADVLVCRVGESLYAYRNACASCSGALAGGGLHGAVLACPTCGTRYDVKLAGRSVESGPLHLHPLPLLMEAEGAKIAVPA